MNPTHSPARTTTHSECPILSTAFAERVGKHYRPPAAFNSFYHRKLSHGEPTFFVRKKVFVTFSNNHHNDGHIAILLLATIPISLIVVSVNRLVWRRLYHLLAETKYKLLG